MMEHTGKASEGVRLNTCDFGGTQAGGLNQEAGEKRAAFRAAVLGHYTEHHRDLPWRRTQNPYRVLVSEVMLQQTQVSRVIQKYEDFIAAFPTAHHLTAAPLTEVLRAWQGLGYNRRALALHRAAHTILEQHGGEIPRSLTELQSLPGIGPATAAAICAFAYDLPVCFIETNIRSAFLHFFFQECTDVPDAELLPLVELTLDRENPRVWYFALMDYGVWVKKTHTNPNRRSRHHARQSPFAGSRRQLRAQILRLFTGSTPSAPPEVTVSETPRACLDRASVETCLAGWDAGLVRAVLRELTEEGFLVSQDGRYRIR